MNVIFFVTNLDSGGIENYLLRFLEFKSSKFKNITVFCKGGRAGELLNNYQNLPNVDIHLKYVSYFKLQDYLYIYRFLKKNKFHSVCDFTGNFSGLILFCAKKAGITKRVVFYRGVTDHFQKTFIKSTYNRFVKSMTLYYATDILSNSKAAFKYFFTQNQKDQRFEVIYNGIDKSKFKVGDKNLKNSFFIPENAYVIGHVGRYNYSKNHKTILHVAERLIKKYTNIYFILCGKGVKKNLELKTIEYGIEKNVRLFENRTDIPIFLNTMDAFFFPSITEGQPNALIEAMIVGLPFVASNIDSIKETVFKNSLLLDPNDVEGYVVNLEKLYKKSESRNEFLKEYAIKRFDHKIKFNEFYNKLVNTIQ